MKMTQMLFLLCLADTAPPLLPPAISLSFTLSLFLLEPPPQEHFLPFSYPHPTYPHLLSLLLLFLNNQNLPLSPTIAPLCSVSLLTSLSSLSLLPTSPCLPLPVFSI